MTESPGGRGPKAVGDDSATAGEVSTDAPIWAAGSAPAERRSWRWRGDVLAGTATAVGVALLGGPIGLLWSTVAPRARVVVLAGGPDLVDPHTKAFIAADGTFLLLTGAAGLLCAVLALVLGGRRHGVATALGLAVGGLAASYLAWRVGHRIGLADFRRAVRGPIGTTTLLNLSLRAKGVLVAWALMGLLTIVAVAVQARRPDQM